MTPELYVEGSDDFHTIIHLLKRHNLLADDANREIELKRTDSDSALLDGMPIAIRAAKNQSVGFVLDIDQSISDRWNRVSQILKSEGARDVPDSPAEKGTIVELVEYKARAGVWLMPDNKTEPGSLETFLKSLIPESDGLFSHAEASTRVAKSDLNAAFSDTHRSKAELHAWLAWQKEPGLPYGTAIKAQYFEHGSPEALAFVEWVKKLYGL